MSTRTLWIPLVLALAAPLACSSGPPPPPDKSVQLAEIARARVATERFMRDNDKSPIPREKRDLLLPLRYYPPDLSYSMPAELKIADEQPVAEMPTSTGTVVRYQRVGVLRFTFMGQDLSLGAFVPEGTRQIAELFVPFADETTGKETYVAGRYLNLPPPTQSGLYTIDFNYAFNPYCAYNKEYECPYPPRTNRLKVPIRAGEKVPAA